MLKLLKLFIKRKRGNCFENPEVQAEAQQRSEEIRQIKHLQRFTEHQRNLAKEKFKLQQLQDQISMYETDYEPEEETSSIEQQLLNIILSNTLGKNTLLSQQQESSNKVFTSQPKDTLTDVEIMGQLKKIPKNYLKIGRKFDDNTLKGFINKNFNYDEDTTNRAIQIFRKQKI